MALVVGMLLGVLISCVVGWLLLSRVKSVQAKSDAAKPAVRSGVLDAKNKLHVDFSQALFSDLFGGDRVDMATASSILLKAIGLYTLSRNAEAAGHKVVILEKSTYKSFLCGELKIPSCKLIHVLNRDDETSEPVVIGSDVGKTSPAA